MLFQSSLLSSTLRALSSIRSRLVAYRTPLLTPALHASTRYDTVLLGGLLGSTFSFCQFLVSPYIGTLSDTYGRRSTLLFSMLGNLLSALIWLFSRNFGTYLLSRVVGGLAEGNVQLSIAIIADVTPPQHRAKALALVGISFACAFTVGPPIGAYLTQNIEMWTRFQPKGVYQGWLTEYSLPAFVTLVLLGVETLFIYAYLPETKGYRIAGVEEKQGAPRATHPEPSTVQSKRSLAQRKQRLAHLERLMTIFSFVFSGE